MKHFSKLTMKLYRKWYKWPILPIPFLFYLSLFLIVGFVQFYLFAFLLINGFDFESLQEGTIIAIVSSIFGNTIWALGLFVTSLKGRRKNLKYVIGVPASILFLTFTIYLAQYSLDFIVDFIAYLFMLIIPMICISTIISLIIYKLTPALFISVYSNTQNFAEPIMSEEDSFAQAEAKT